MLFERKDIPGSIHGNAQNKSSSTLSLLLDIVFMALRADCLPQNAFGNCTFYCAQRGLEILIS